MVDVTTEALQTVKNALSTFQSDISGLSMRATDNADDITEECKSKINLTKTEIAQVETQIAILNKQISNLEAKIEQATNQYNALLARIPQLENNIRSLNSRISALNSQIASLRSQLANTEDDDERQQIQEQINALSRQVSQCEAERSQLESELQNSEQKKAELQQTINSAKSQKAQCESELSTQKNRCNKMKDKLERLNTTYSRVELDLNAYVAATKKFEGNASERTQSNTSAIEKCMKSIEEYLSINIGFGLHHGNTPREQLSNYMNSHNYGIDDYSTYSQDPEWQRLHNQVYGTSHSDHIELPSSEHHFCGLPIQRMPNGTWGVISSCYEAYDAYSQNADDYTCESFNAIEIRTVNAREIAGIDMISDREIDNPQLFWGRSGGTYESFEAIAQLIPEVQERIDGGDNLSNLMSDDRLGACASLFFNTNSPDHPTVYVGDGFYELSGGGRHRVMLAQRLGFSIPVRVRGRIIHR